jgi:hypothetical protein
MVGTAFLGLSYWDLLYHLIFIAVLVKKFALEELAAQPQNLNNLPLNFSSPRATAFR